MQYKACESHINVKLGAMIDEFKLMENLHGKSSASSKYEVFNSLAFH